MAKDDKIEIDGEVIKNIKGDSFIVRLENGAEITAKCCGKMKMNKIKVIVGDKVKVGLSPYDLTKGLITFRYK